MRETTTDRALGGAILVRQHRDGYRFSIDAFLLAGFLQPDPNSAVLDLGSGCGIIPLILARRYAGLTVFGIEIQTELARLANANAVENGMGDRVKIVEGDLRHLKKNDLPQPIALAIANPPFRQCNTGRINPDSQRAIARHEVAVTLAELLATAGRVLDPGGRFATIYPSERLADLLICMRRQRIEPKRLRMIHSERSADAKRLLVEGIKEGRPGLAVLTPLVVYRGPGVYTEEVGEMLR
jgi:tRNA1Val (adenine37-N6)-methyltransferase